MADTLHLQKRGDTWHYYRRVPSHLVSIIGKRFIKRSLGTASRTEAKRIRSVEDTLTDAQFLAAEAALKSGDGDAKPIPPKPVVRRCVLKH